MFATFENIKTKTNLNSVEKVASYIFYILKHYTEATVLIPCYIAV